MGRIPHLSGRPWGPVPKNRPPPCRRAASAVCSATPAIGRGGVAPSPDRARGNSATAIARPSGSSFTVTATLAECAARRGRGGGRVLEVWVDEEKFEFDDDTVVV